MTDAPTTPAGRQIVVVRAGPPKRGRAIDAIVGILGVALLIMAGVLGEVLPEEEFIPIQYLPEYPTNGTDTIMLYEGATFNSLRLDFVAEGDSIAVPFAVDRDNVYSVQVNVFLPGDDIAASEPDVFTFTILDRDGNSLDVEPFEMITKPPIERDPTEIDPDDPLGATGPIYVAQETRQAQTFRFAAAPEQEFLSGSNGRDITRVEALRFVVQEHTLQTNGTWTLIIEMDRAGDCRPPTGTPSADHTQRFAACNDQTTPREGQPEQPGGARGQDVGNPVTITKIRYDYYDIEVPEP